MVAFEVMLLLLLLLLHELSWSIWIVCEKPFNSSNSFLLGFGFGAVEKGIGSFFGMWIKDFILDDDVEQKVLESKDEICKEAIVL